MDEQDAGGPAFPLPYESDDVRPFYRGMTLRDYFAAMSMQTLIVEEGSIQKYAEIAYEMADAMLEARKQ